MFGVPRMVSIGGGKAKSSAGLSEVKIRSRELEYQVERLLMITEALWQILKEQHGYTDDELIERVARIDLKDGKLDGKVASSGPVKCRKCERTTASRHPKCIYCGTPVIKDPFAR